MAHILSVVTIVEIKWHLLCLSRSSHSLAYNPISGSCHPLCARLYGPAGVGNRVQQLHLDIWQPYTVHYSQTQFRIVTHSGRSLTVRHSTKQSYSVLHSSNILHTTRKVVTLSPYIISLYTVYWRVACIYSPLKLLYCEFPKKIRKQFLLKLIMLLMCQKNICVSVRHKTEISLKKVLKLFNNHICTFFFVLSVKYFSWGKCVYGAISSISVHLL